MPSAADGGRDERGLPERRGDARRESGLEDSGADDGALPPSDATENALQVQSLDISAVAAQLSLSPRGLLSRLLRDGDGEAPGNVVTVDVPVVRDKNDSRAADHDARSSLSSSSVSRRARRAEATDAENAAASHALFAATATAPPVRLSRRAGFATRDHENDRLESLAPLLRRGERTSPDASPSPREADSPEVSRGYLVGVPVGSALVPDARAKRRAVAGVEPRVVPQLPDEARVARAVADATDGEVGEDEAAAAAADAAAAASVGGGEDTSTRLAAGDDDVLVRRVIFAVPSQSALGEGTARSGTAAHSGIDSGASPETNGDSKRRRLKFGGASTRFSLPTAVTNVTLEMRSRDGGTTGREIERIDELSDENGAYASVWRDDDSRDASSERSENFFAEAETAASRKRNLGGVPLRRLRASVTVERRVPVIGWLILAAAIVSLSAMGTMVTLERSKPFTQSSWRAQSVLLVSVPWAAARAKKQGLRGFREKNTRRRALLVALCWSGWFLTLFYGLDTTSIAHAYMLTNTTSAVIVAYKALTARQSVPRSHFVGVALAMAGAGVVMWQSSFGSEKGSATVVGDAVVAAGAFSGAAFLVLAKGVREEIELSLLVVLQMLVNLPISLALAFALERCSFAEPLDPRRGVLGWLTASQIGKQLVISVCGTIIGTCGYIASLKYLAPTVVAIAMLLEPILAALIGWVARVNAFPDWKTCAGMALVALGTAIIAVDAGRARARTVDVDAHRNR